MGANKGKSRKQIDNAKIAETRITKDSLLAAGVHPCQKKRYETKEMAEKDIPKPQHAYVCPLCLSYHRSRKELEPHPFWSK